MDSRLGLFVSVKKCLHTPVPRLVNDIGNSKNEFQLHVELKNHSRQWQHQLNEPIGICLQTKEEGCLFTVQNEQLKFSPFFIVYPLLSN